MNTPAEIRFTDIQQSIHTAINFLHENKVEEAKQVLINAVALTDEKLKLVREWQQVLFDLANHI